MYDSEALSDISMDDSRDLPFDFGGRVHGLLYGPQDGDEQYVSVNISVHAQEAADRGIVFDGRAVEDVGWDEREAANRYLTDRIRRDMAGKLDPLLLNETYVESGTSDDEGFEINIRIPRDYPQSLDTVFDDAISPIGERAGRYVDPDDDLSQKVWGDFDMPSAPVSGTEYQAPYDEVMRRALEASKAGVGPTGKVKISRVFDAHDPMSPGVRSTFEDGSFAEFYPDMDEPDSGYVCARYDSDGRFVAQEESDMGLLGADIASQAEFADPGYVSRPEDVTEGFYASTDADEIYRVAVSPDTGKLYAQELRKDGGWRPAQLSAVSGTHRAHTDELAKHGAAAGRCVICGRPLEGASAAKGIGPKCEKDYAK